MKAILLSEQVGAGAGAFKDGFRAIIGEGEILKDFSRADKKELGKEVVAFIKSFAKGDHLKPLDKDTVYFSTFTRPELKNAAGEVVCPRERVLHIDKVLNKGEGCGVTVSSNPLVLEDGHICSYPLTLDGVKAAYKELLESAKTISEETVK